jgi:hypothetical protein
VVHAGLAGAGRVDESNGGMMVEERWMENQTC